MPATKVNLRRLATIVQHDLLDLENGDDMQIASAARLLTTLCDARVQARLPAQLTDPVIQSAIASIRLRGESRSASVRLHQQLSLLAETLNVPVAEGGYPKVPDGIDSDPAAAEPALAGLAR